MHCLLVVAIVAVIAFCFFAPPLETFCSYDPSAGTFSCTTAADSEDVTSGKTFFVRNSGVVAAPTDDGTAFTPQDSWAYMSSIDQPHARPSALALEPHGPPDAALLAAEPQLMQGTPL